MSVQLCILASGSAGNATLVRTPEAVFLIDCGIPPRLAEVRMKRLGVALADIAAICVTHLDHDHFNPSWASAIIQHDIAIFCAAGEMMTLLSRTGEADLSQQLRPFDDEPFEPVPGLAARAIPVAHDDAGSHAFHLDGHGARVGYATDLGHVPAALLDRFCGVDLLAIESNYDPELQRLSGRPMFLQRRITGGRGHLSNAQALAAVRTLLDRCQHRGHRLPRHVVLLHRSRQCNCPDLVREMFAAEPRLRGRVVLAEQHWPSGWLDATPTSPPPAPLLCGQQLSWAWG
jgi:phosphoribosyl 1,2-cyclic phosphodiesterase